MNGESPLDRFRRWYSLLPPALRLLMTVNTVIFFAWFFVRLIPAAEAFVVNHLALAATPRAFFQPWQFVTHSVLHLDIGFMGFISFAFNMLWLYWMGRDYEETFGSHRLFGLYVLSAVAGGLLAVLGGSLVVSPPVPLFGAMGAVFGMLFCVATLYPNRGIGLFLLGVVPMKWLAGGFLALSVLFSLGFPALILLYLGSAGMGYLFAKAQQNGTDLAAWAQVFFPSRTARSAPASRTGEKESAFSRMERWLAGRSKGESKPPRSDSPRSSDPPRRSKRRARPAEPAAAGPADIDRILDKINERGYDALTEEEKRILFEASQDE